MESSSKMFINQVDQKQFQSIEQARLTAGSATHRGSLPAIPISVLETKGA